MELQISDWQRLFGKLESGPPHLCRPWRGSKGAKGYGEFSVRGTHQAHRVVFEALCGPITEETLDHLCHTRSLTCPGGLNCPHRICTNTLHLEPVSIAENARREHRRRAVMRDYQRLVLVAPEEAHELARQYCDSVAVGPGFLPADGLFVL